ncbi:Protein detoxification 14 [Vitis vinifera]|uniref:Protein detoxification 14 n=1 Tax=Vitis vinifera TaxID=29760 RepID=A0A438C1A7_VITVI|nr:Protein detoxification 14 [Vitis vinifera]
MEENLLVKGNGGEKREEEGLRWVLVCEEVKRLGCLAAPMVAVVLSQYLVQVVSVMMVGHLGELALSSTAIAISLSGVSGFSLLLGMASALETLCGQAYGAKQYSKLGTQTYTAIFSLFLLVNSQCGLFLHYLLMRLFSHLFGLGNLGAALAISISYWLNAIFLVLYMKYSSACEKTRVPVSMEVFQGMGEFFRFAIPSAVMICLEWWSFELLILLSGLLPNPELETSVLSVCLNTISTLYTIPYGLGAAGSTRVSNELGAGNPQKARLAVYALMFLAVTETALVSTTLFASRRVFGYLFSNEKEVVDYVTNMSPLVCLSVILDSMQGFFLGCGWQHIGAFINLGAFYLCGIPVAATLAFWLQLRGRGLWIGIQTVGCQLDGGDVRKSRISKMTSSLDNARLPSFFHSPLPPWQTNEMQLKQGSEYLREDIQLKID